MAPKPRLLFFQYRYDPALPAFLLVHKQDHVACLSRSFDVTVIDEDCDYARACDEHRPDLVLFEAGVNHVTCRRPEIENVRAHRRIPKIALHNADPFCNARAGFFSDLDRWGVEAVFSIATTAAEHMPELAHILYVWPNFVDPAVYRDYGATKSIPVLVTGNRNALYPWRQRVLRLVTRRYPHLVCPHPGYDPESAAVKFLFGESYARTLNASLTVPTCGTVAREVVRKHFEIPACRSCLVTERSASLEAAGFVDLENCVFADEHDVLDKLEHLFRHPDQLASITDAGHRLVLEHHTLDHRDQLRQWLELRRELQPGHEIIQPNPFEPLVVVRSGPGMARPHLSGGGLHLELIRQGDRLLARGDAAGAEAAYLRCKGYMPWMPEPRLRVAICRLYQGDARTALAWIEELLTFVLAQYRAVDPDPVEWAYSIVALLCLGRRADALRSAREFPWLRHPELDRARWAAATLSGAPAPAIDGGAPARRTIHLLPGGAEAWLERVSAMLSACGRARWAGMLRAAAGPGGPRAAATDPASAPPRQPERPPGAPQVVARLEQGLRRRALAARVRKGAGRWLHALERLGVHVLPFRLSDARRDDFYSTVREVMAEEDVRSALVVGAVPGRWCTEAMLSGAVESPAAPRVFCLELPAVRLPRGRRGGRNTVWIRVARGEAALGAAIDGIAAAHGVRAFDVVLVDAAAAGAALATAGVEAAVSGARFVFLEGTNELEVQALRDRLLVDPAFEVVTENPGTRRGYAVFARLDPARRPSARSSRASGEP